MSIDRDVLEAVREMGEPELRRLLMLAQARLQTHGVALGATPPDIKVRSQSVRCGKPTCSRCPHGPYWYAYWREDGKRRSKYLGKLDELPEHVAQGIAAEDKNLSFGSTGS
ncbi:MAG TPA: hypothetical protein ENG98_02060 [Actinobacteria bacterium]|nr:hypothetical protein BMS3Bbin02_00913 [bacterium BMS3Bbin02]HDL41784.1 hypothetical protein [Actinomycetota bacterium]